MRRFLSAIVVGWVLLAGASASAQQLTGPEVVVAVSPTVPNGTSSQRDPNVAIGGTGHVFVAWERTEDDIFSSSNSAILGRYFSATDSAPTEFFVADDPNFDESGPSLAGNGAGKVVVAYSNDDLSNIPACTTTPYGKVFRKVYLNGTFSSFEQVNSNGGGGRKGAVGMASTGTYAVAYEGNECPGLGYQRGIKARRFDPALVSGFALDGVLSELPLSVGVDTAGGIGIVVADGSSGVLCETAAPCPLVVRRFGANGAALSTVQFDNYANSGPVTTFDPVIAMRGDGGFVVVWVRLDFGTDQTLFVVGRRYDAAGNAAGGEFEVSAGVVPDFTQNFGSPSIAMNQGGDFVVGFVVAGKAYVRSYRADGAATGAPVEIANREVAEIGVALGDDGQGVVGYRAAADDTIYYRRFAGSTPPPCVVAATRLCLNNGRFSVTATWRTGTGASGVGQAVAMTADTGYFWFFNSANVEAVVKVLNGCGVNNRYWFFAGGLTDVGVTFTVQDSQTGATRTYTNPLGSAFQPIQDTSALVSCP
jgi:hypothetical protein